MRTMGRAFAVVSIALMIGVGVTSCQNDTIDSGSQGITVNFIPNPSGAGRFDRATFDINTLTVRPQDPALTPVFGSTNLSLRFQPFTADMTKTTTSLYSQIALPAGTYVVRRITLTSPQLVDMNLTPGAACLDQIAAFPSGPATGAVPATFVYDDPASLTFTVHPGQTVLRLTADIPGIIDSYENAFTCDPTCFGQGSACLTAFDTAGFTNTYLTHITLQ